MKWFEKIGWAILAVAAIGLGGCAQEEPVSGSWVEYIRPLQLTEEGFSPEEHPSFQSVEVEPDRLVFDFGGENPLVANMVVAGNSGGGPEGYLRRVTAVEVLPDGQVAATTTSATFEEFVADVHFVFHHEPDRSPTTAGGPGMLVASEVRAGCEDSGTCEIAGEYETDLGGAGSCSASGSLSATLRPILEPDFSGTELEVDYCILCRRPFLMAEMRLAGSLTVGAELTTTANIAGQCSLDLIQAVTGAPAPEISLGGVPIGPVTIVFSLEPVVEGCVSGAVDAGAVRAWATGTIAADLTVGWDSRESPNFYSDGPNFVPSAEAGIETTRAGGVRLAASVAAGGIFHMRFWGVAGPWARIVGHVGAEFEALAGACDWTVRVPWNVDWQLGADIDVRIWSASVSWPDSPQFLFGDSVGPGQCIPVTGSNILYQTGGTWGWCESIDPMCDPDTSDTVCNGDYLGVNVCPGQTTFEWCSGMTQIRRCTCDSSGRLSDCSPCTDPPFSG